MLNFFDGPTTDRERSFGNEGNLKIHVHVDLNKCTNFCGFNNQNSAECMWRQQEQNLTDGQCAK